MFTLLFSVLLLSGAASGLTREYIPVTFAKNWTDAQSFCREKFRALATITTEEENQRLRAVIENRGDAWIGMYREQTNTDVWLWADKTPVSFFQWDVAQPSNNLGNQSCVEVRPGGWNDQFCYEERVFVCYKNLVLVKENKTWEEAVKLCKRKYGGVASPSTEEQVKLAEMESIQTQTDSIWTGLHFLNGRWLWINKKPLGNLVSLPSCPALNYRCGALNIKAHRWENRDCNQKLNFLCYF